MNVLKKNDNTLVQIKRKKKRYDPAHWELTSMVIVGVVYAFVFSYVPLYGILVAFKDFRYDLGIIGSPWVGFKNFEYIFKTKLMQRLIRNTLGYNLWFMLQGTIFGLIFAMCLEKMKSKWTIRAVQTSMQMPGMLSWIVVSYVVYALFAPTTGVVNTLLNKMGMEMISFYEEPKYWPFIFAIFAIWHGAGGSMLLYYGKLLSIDTELYEAATIDGGSAWQKFIYITVPMLRSMMTLILILDLGKIFHGNTGLFRFLTKNSPSLYNVSDNLDTYILRTLNDGGNLSRSSAANFLQTVCGLVLVLASNLIVRKIDPDSALF